MSQHQNIKHISFDVWNTLIFPNRDFAFYRTNFIRNYLLNDMIPFNEVKRKYTEMKQVLDEEATAGFPAMSVVDNWVRLGDSLPSVKFTSQEDFEREIIPTIEELVRLHPPIIPNQTILTLHDLKKAGYTLSIASNTNFVGGKVLLEIIEERVGKDVFSFALFSDETGCSKPSAEMFDDVFNRTAELYLPHMTFRDEILHVGDHFTCDVLGATNANMYALYVGKLADMYDELQHYINNPVRNKL